jgi:hypothetical protein
LPYGDKHTGDEVTRARKAIRLYSLVGGPDRDRTDDLFHAMENLKT